MRALTSVAVEPVRLEPGLALRARLGALRTPWATTCLVLDAAMLGAAIAAAELGASAGGAAMLPESALAAFAAVTLGLFHVRGLYAGRLRFDILDDTRSLLAATTVAAALVLAVLMLTSGAADPYAAPAGIARVWGFTCVYIVAGRAAFYWSQTQARRRGDVVTPTLVVGHGRVARLTAQRLLGHRDLGLLPIGFVAPSGAAAASRADDQPVPMPVLGTPDEIDRLVDQYDVQQVVVVCSDDVVDDDVLPMLKRCEELGIAAAYVPGLHERFTRSLRIEYVGGLPLITAYAPDPKGWRFALKYGLDRVIAAVLVALFAPVLVACAVAVWISLGRPILFRQRRVGLDGHEFDMLKFRTMRGTPTESGEADAAWAAAQTNGEPAPAAQAADDRRTRVGAFLRRSSLDELPQIVNVLRGDMSLVGPRPERTHYVELFDKSIYRYGERHRVKSGVTGWSQVNGLRGKTSLADRAEWDNWYIENWSLWLDVKILLLTVAAVLRFFKRGE